MIKLNNTLYTKNKMGLSDKDLELCEIGLHYEHIKVPMVEPVSAERAGQVLTIRSPIVLDLEPGYLAFLEPNPKLFKLGSLGFMPTVGPEDAPVRPDMVLKMFKAGTVDLDYLFKIRLGD